MREDHAEFERLRAKIVVVTRHDREQMQRHWAENKLPFIGVSDPDGAISARYGQQWKLLKLGRMPAQFVIDCADKIAFAHYGRGMADIPPNSQMIEIMRGLATCAPAVR